MLKKFFWQNLLVTGLVIVGLTGCSASWRQARPSSTNTGTVKGAVIGTAAGAGIGAAVGGTTTGAIVGGVTGAITGSIIGHYLAKHETLVQRLAANHVQVILVGDNLRLILPSDLFFASNTPVLNENYYPVLNQIALLLRGLNKYVVKVSGYTDDIGWPTRSLALSRQQAQAIANYLWNQGIDARVLYATGYGSQMPITSNTTAAERAMNRRIEITLRQITDDRYQ